jgi:hypothetical protein
MMPLSLLAQAGVGGIAQWAIWLIVIAGIIGIVIAVAKYSGVQIPPILITVAWILFAVFVGVVAIKFLVGFV